LWNYIYKQRNILRFEAVQPVGWMPLKEWIAKGVNSHYVVKRLKNADTILTDATIKKMKKRR